MRFRCSLTICLILFFISGPVFAYTYTQVGINSNFIIHENKVYFTQSDSTLTVLDLQTGSVIARKRNSSYGGTLLLTDCGILVRGYNSVTMIDLATSEVLWQGKDVYDSEIAGQCLISYDGNGIVECRNLATGAVLWSYNLPGALDIVAENGKVLVFRSAEYDGPEGVPAIVLLDLKTGGEIFRKTTPAGIHYLEAYFDGQEIYLPSGAYEGAHIPNRGGYDSGRPSARFEKLIVWDLEGNEIESLSIPENFDADCLNFNDTFTFSEKTFCRGRVWESPDIIPPWKLGGARSIERFEPDTQTTVKVELYDVVDGVLRITRTMDFSSKKGNYSIELETESYLWAGCLPYLNKKGKVAKVGSTKERILLGSNLGHIECIDIESGKSIWMYKFPTLRHTMSFSSRGMPPYMATANSIYKRENQHISMSGLLLDGSTEVSKPIMIFDPCPAEPFKKLPLYLTLVWTGSIISIASLCLIVFLGRKKRWDSRHIAFWGLALSMISILLLFRFGRVSVSSSIFLRITLLSSLVIAFSYSVIAFQRKHRLFSCLLLFLLSGITLFIFPVLLNL